MPSIDNAASAMRTAPVPPSICDWQFLFDTKYRHASEEKPENERKK
jgi:hypothetical protein